MLGAMGINPETHPMTARLVRDAETAAAKSTVVGMGGMMAGLAGSGWATGVGGMHALMLTGGAGLTAGAIGAGIGAVRSIYRQREEAEPGRRGQVSVPGDPWNGARPKKIRNPNLNGKQFGEPEA
jgi:hypothetical protein